MKIGKRTSIINHFIQKNKYKTYLEIGIRNAATNFNRIICKHKEGIDPNPKCHATHIMTSDDFFTGILLDCKYDIIFIDGLHLEEQVMKDILNSLKHLNKNGTILVHDCNPKTKESQLEKKIKKPWNGTVWKAFSRLRMTRKDLEMYVICVDQGIGIIRKGKQSCFPKTQELTYEFLEENRKKLLNLITKKEFKTREKIK